MSKVPIQVVLSNICDELFSLSGRLKDVEHIIFAADDGDKEQDHLQEMQDMDLIIQQISDLARAIRAVAEVELEDAMLTTSVLGDRLHLNDLRQRLLGLSEDRLLSAPEATNDILLF